MTGRDTGLLIKQIDEALKRRANTQLAEVGLTLSQMNVLFVLVEQPSHSASFKQVERAIKASQPTTAGLISRLEAKGLVETSPSPIDQRAKLVRLTAAGEKRCAQGREFIALEDAAMTKGMSAEEAQQLDALLARMLKNLSD